MAQPHYGGSRSPPRVHRPRAVPIMSVSPTPITAPLAPLRPPPPLVPVSAPSSSAAIAAPPPAVSLVTPRPENERITNEYVEAPFRSIHHPHPLPGGGVAAAPPSPPERLTLPPPPPPPPPAITKQPATFSKPGAGPDLECATRPSIVCPQCGRCRCESCQQPRPLPQRWVCNNACLVSPDSIIDFATCLCCVKGLFYHCSETDGGAGESCADNPCGCGPNSVRPRARWGCLTALSFVLPCLWLYWPLQGCKRAVEVCYARHSRTGCRCRPVRPIAADSSPPIDAAPTTTTTTNSPPSTLQKRLLDSTNSDC